MIRVAFVLPSFAGGGAERVMINIANNIDRSHFAARLIVLDPTGPLAGLAADHVPVLPLNRARLHQALPALRRALRAKPTDVAVSTMGYLNVGLLLLRPFLPRRMKLIVREANMPLMGTGGQVARGLGLAMRVLYPRADHVICPAQRIADALLGRFPIPAGRLRVIPNPVDEDFLRIKAEPPVRHPGPGLRLVAAGRLVEQKGFNDLIALMPLLPTKAHLTILGDGPLRASLADQAATPAMTGRVCLAGFQDNPWRYYAGADAFVLPSLWEGQSNAALEALALGAPVIATPQSGGIGELAEQAAPGAVRIVAMGPAFAGAIMRSDIVTGLARRPSLAPPTMRLGAIVARYQAMLADETPQGGAAE